MIYHPMTAKNTSQGTQQFRFERAEDEKENYHRGDIARLGNTNPAQQVASKRSTSVKNSNQVQILKEHQIIQNMQGHLPQQKP